MPIYIYKGNSQISTNAVRNDKAVKAIYAKEQGKDAVCVWGSDDIAIFEYTVTDNKITITGLKQNKEPTSLTIPAQIEGLAVTSIAPNAFKDKNKIKEVVIPNSVTSIGDSAFYGCYAIQEIYITDIAAWCSISGLSNLMGHGSYYKNLYINNELATSVIIPDSVTSIGEQAFRDCKGLTSVTIGNSVTSIGNDAFNGCIGLTSLSVVEGNTKYHSAGNCIIETVTNTLILGCKTSVIPTDGSVTSIDHGSFAYCTGLTSITIPDSVTSIRYWAFAGCTGLTSVTIGNGVTLIGSSAFGDCSGLTSITIPNSVTSINGYAFSGCTGLTSITGSTTNVSTVATQAKPTSFVVNATSGTNISDSAFSGCTGLTSITIPDSVTSIGSSAFSGCSSLESITIPFVGAKAGVTSSDTYQYPFGYIFGMSSYDGGVATEQHYYGNSTSSTTSETYYIPSSLKSVTVTGGNILYGAFYNCAALTSITIPNSVTSIGSWAFRGCAGLTNMTIPNGVTSIGDAAFYECSRLTSITIPNSVTSIDEYAFRGCTGLTSVTIPDSVTSIDMSTFSGCTALTSITIPNSVTRIGYGAFYGCAGLTNITFNGTIAQWNAISKGTNWNSGTGNYTIHCTDGDISKS